MRFHENPLPADHSHEIIMPNLLFLKAVKFEIVVCCKLKVALYGLRPLVAGKLYIPDQLCSCRRNILIWVCNVCDEDSKNSDHRSRQLMNWKLLSICEMYQKNFGQCECKRF